MTSNFRNILPNNILVMLLAMMLFLAPLLPVSYHFFAYNLLFSCIVIASAFSLQTERRKVILAASAIAITLEWITFKFNHPTLSLLSRTFLVAFFVFIVFGLIRQTTTAKKVNERVIVDSISGYLLVGVIYGIIVFAIFRFQPDAYRFPGGPVDAENVTEQMGDMFYFAFVTYTTTGYGDILPATPGTKSLSTLISATGQLYIAIIIAMLVGKFASGIGKER